MGLDLWFRRDVARILAATWAAMQSMTQYQSTLGPRQEAEDDHLGAVATSDDRAVDAYQQGFADALRAVGVAFGLAESSGAARAGAIPASGCANESSYPAQVPPFGPSL
jgi:hypothetical protein